MPEVPHSGEEHREPRVVRGGYHLFVTNRAARLDNGGRPRFGGGEKPSANGKKASDATAEPMVRGSGQPFASAASRALIAAIRALSRRFIWPAPMPAVTPSFA